ncbi:hypothetical protein ACHAW6_010803 [Cyclotella cf. meneghiniana]
MTAPRNTGPSRGQRHRHDGIHYQDSHDSPASSNLHVHFAHESPKWRHRHPHHHGHSYGYEEHHDHDGDSHRQDESYQRHATINHDRSSLLLPMTTPSFSPSYSSSSSCSSPSAPRDNQHSSYNVVSSSQLFHLMNHGLWDKAIEHLATHPTDARIWIISRFASGEVKWKNLPLHLACTAGHDGLKAAPSSFSPSLRLVQTLIEAFPRATMHTNFEGNLPIHLACDTLSFTHYGSEAEGILAALIHTFPQSLILPDSSGMTPAEILEHRGVRVQDGRWGGTILRYMKQKMEDLVTDQSESFDLTPLEGGSFACEERQEQEQERRTAEDAVHTHFNCEHVEHHSANEKEFMRTIVQTDNDLRDVHTLSPTDRKIFYPANIRQETTKESGHTIIDSSHRIEGHAITRLRTDRLHKQVVNPTSQFGSPSHSLETDHSSFNSNFYNHTSVVSPANHYDITSTPKSDTSNQPISSTAYPFHYLEQELHSLKVAHRSMAELLNAKISNENDLRACLAKLEEVHTKLETEYNSLEDTHSNALEKLKEMDRLLDDKNRELQVMRTKENAVSSELAWRFRRVEEQENELNSLQKRLDQEKEARLSMEKELQHQKSLSSKLKETNEQMAHSNNDLAKQLSAARTKKQELIQDAVAFKEELATKDKQLNEAKTKESSLCEQLMTKLSSLDALEKKIRETQTMLTEEQTKNRELERELLVLREKAANDASWRAEKKKNASTETQVQADRGRHNRIDLRKIEWRSHNLSDGNARGDQSECNILGSDETLKMLTPIVHDALNIQEEVIQRAWQLLHKANFTRRLIEEVPRQSAPIFSFRPTLQMLEDIITTHINMIGDFANAIASEESCQSKLSSLPGINLDQLSSVFAQSDFNSDDIFDILKHETSSRKQYSKLAAATRNHVHNIESLHKMASELQPLKLGNVKNDEFDRRHMSVANEMMSLFQRAMANLLKDTKHIISLMDDTGTLLHDDFVDFEKQLTACAI